MQTLILEAAGKALALHERPNPEPTLAMVRIRVGACTCAAPIPTWSTAGYPISDCFEYEVVGQDAARKLNIRFIGRARSEMVVGDAIYLALRTKANGCIWESRSF